MDGNENAHSTLIALSPEDLHDLLEKAAEVGANAGIDKYVEELKKSQKKREIEGSITRNFCSVISTCYRRMRKTPYSEGHRWRSQLQISSKA